MQCNALRTCLALVFIPCLLPAQTPGPARLTAGFRGGFAIPHLAGTGSPYQGDVQMAWRGDSASCWVLGSPWVSRRR